MWLYVLIALGSIPVLVTVFGIPWAFYAEWRRNRRIMARMSEGERRLSDRWLADQVMADDANFARALGYLPPVDDLGQASNPRARP